MLNNVHVQNWLPYIMLILLFRIPHISINIHMTCQFFIINIYKTNSIFIFTGARDVDICVHIFSPSLFPFPPLLTTPFLLSGHHHPLPTYFFFFNYCFFIEIASGSLCRGERIKNPQFFVYHSTKKKPLKTVTYYFMHKLTSYVHNNIYVSFAHFFPTQ